jgi:uncharacterized protein YbdZ (MbtH family)
MSLRTLSIAVLAATLAASGCRRAEEIQSYNVPKEVREQVVPASIAADATDRMLAGVLPDGDRAWFFKVTGPLTAIDSQTQAIETFFASVRPAPGKPHPDWQVPAGWQEQAGSGMRAATLMIPAGEQSLELSVTALPWQGAPGELLSNVNRWRGQMQMAPTDERGLAECTRELKAGDGTMTVVDLSGRFQNTRPPPLAGGAMSGAGTPPFAGGGAKPAAPNPTPAANQNQSALPPGHPPIQGQGMMAAPATATPAANAPFKFELPAGWEERPASGMRKAEFRIVRDGKTATLTAIDFPVNAGPMMADPIANVKRWRGEVGLPPASEEELAKTIEAIKVGGAEAKFVDAVPDPSQANQSQAQEGTLAAMVTHGDTIWFLKLRGDRELVAAERDNFKKFLASVEFPGAGGANDGDE